MKPLNAYDAADVEPRNAADRMPMRLVVNGDDFGLSESINDGIIRAHSHGILTSTSIAAAGAAFDTAVALARRHPTLDVGVHLTLTEERPAAPPECVPSLLADGERLWPNPTQFMRRFLRGAIAIREVAREFEAQLARVLEQGMRVTHLDGHQHLHVLPGIRQEVAALAQRHGIPFVRRPRERLRPFMLGDAHRFGRLAAMMTLNLVCGPRVRRGAAATDDFVGFYFGGRLNKANLMTLIAGLPRSGTCELMCHPGSAATELRDRGGVYDRHAECNALCDPDVRLELNARGVDLVSFADLSTAP
jgi:predicted glycoside hydrolase/deacetylase ChbG (UPF0249 family)